MKYFVFLFVFLNLGIAPAQNTEGYVTYSPDDMEKFRQMGNSIFSKSLNTSDYKWLNDAFSMQNDKLMEVNCIEYKENSPGKISIRSKKRNIQINLNDKSEATTAVDLLRSTKYSYKRVPDAKSSRGFKWEEVPVGEYKSYNTTTVKLRESDPILQAPGFMDKLVEASFRCCTRKRDGENICYNEFIATNSEDNTKKAPPVIIDSTGGKR